MNTLKSNWVSQIKNHRKKIYSQCGEEGFIEFILQNIGVDMEKMNIVEFGAGDGVSLSNSKYFIEKGCHAMRFDGNPKGAKDVHQLWLNKDEVNHIAVVCNATRKCDVLMIDVDGNDYWFIKEFIKTVNKKPSLVVCEINPIFKRDEHAVMPYNPDHPFKDNDYYGMSLNAVETMMQKFGYELIFVNDSLNAYFVYKKLLPEGIEIPEIEYRRKQDHPPFREGMWLMDHSPFITNEKEWTLEKYHL